MTAIGSERIAREYALRPLLALLSPREAKAARLVGDAMWRASAAYGASVEGAEVRRGMGENVGDLGATVVLEGGR